MTSVIQPSNMPHRASEPLCNAIDVQQLTLRGWIGRGCMIHDELLQLRFPPEPAISSQVMRWLPVEKFIGQIVTAAVSRCRKCNLAYKLSLARKKGENAAAVKC